MQNQESPIFVHLNLTIFKIKPCRNKNKHNAKLCMFYHFKQEKRRNILKYNYKKIMCRNKTNCPKKNKCGYSHNFIEQIYHPDSYKKKFCKDFYTNKKCSYGQFCALAHCVKELKLKPLHVMQIDQNFLFFYFKSEFCPFSKIEHDRFTCVYAHNWQDFKRPWFKNQIPQMCQNWNIKKEIVEYKDGCKDQFECNYCHGWKELEFHLQNFKKSSCKQKDCKKKEICSFQHQDYQQNKKIQPNSFLYLQSFQPDFREDQNLQQYFDFVQVKIPEHRIYQNYDFSTQVSQNCQNFQTNRQNNSNQINQELLFFYNNFSKSLSLSNTNFHSQSIQQQFKSVQNVENEKKGFNPTIQDSEEEPQILEEGSSLTVSERELESLDEKSIQSKDHICQQMSHDNDEYLKKNTNQGIYQNLE